MKKKIGDSSKKTTVEPFDPAAYNRNYNRDHQVRKQLYFNREVPADVELLSWVRKHKNFTKYIKGLIRQDMEANGAAEPVKDKNQTSFLP